MSGKEWMMRGRGRVEDDVRCGARSCWKMMGDNGEVDGDCVCVSLCGDDVEGDG
jgi:hypothetical protein